MEYSAFCYESASEAPMPLEDLKDRLLREDFTLIAPGTVQELASLIFHQMFYEAFQLQDSPLTSAFARRNVLKHGSLSSLLAQTLACKMVRSTMPRVLEWSGDPVDADRREQEQALRSTMLAVYSAPDVLRCVVADLAKAFLSDPAAEGFLQLALYFKGFHAVSIHRVAHELWKRGGAVNRHTALMLQSRVSELFSVDIHPGATIGAGVMIDHATGVVIGGTAVLGDDIMMLHQVTLGASGKPTHAKRHPTVGSHVVLGAGSIVLGDVTIGSHCVIGARAIVTKSVDDWSTVVEINKVIRKEDPVVSTQTPLGQECLEGKIDAVPPAGYEYVGMWNI